MNVGLIQVTSRKSPTSCRKTLLMTTSKCASGGTAITLCKISFNGVPCQGGGQWFWVEDIPLPSGHTVHQRIYESLMTKIVKKKFSLLSQSKKKKTNSCEGASASSVQQILTSTVIAVSRWEFDSHNLLQVVCHAHSSEWWSEINLIGLSLWTIRVISHLVSSSDVLHHS